MMIKEAAPADAQTLSKIHAESWKAAYIGMVPQAYLDGLKKDFWVPAFEAWLSGGAARARIAYENDLPVGCVVFGRSRDEKLPDFGEIISIYVLPAYFRMGYGKILLQSALAALREDGLERVYLWVLDENANARYFYEKNGFSRTQDHCIVKIMQEKLKDVRYIYDPLGKTGENAVYAQG